METLDLSRRGVLLNDEQLGPYPLEKLKRVERLTVDIVEDSPRVDEKEMAFAKCRLGGFGDVLKKRMEDFTVRVPIGASYYHFQKYLNDYPENEVAPEKAPLPEDTRIVTRHIKKMAYFTGAEMVGVCEVPRDVYYATKVDGTPVERVYRYAVVFLVRTQLPTIAASHGDEWLDDTVAYQAYQRLACMSNTLADYIRRLGWPARSDAFNNYVTIMPRLVALAGLGEFSRLGIVVNPFMGAAFKAAAVLTDLPLVPDGPIDFGLQNYCSVCKICAEQCPMHAISTGEQEEYRGYMLWRTDVVDLMRCGFEVLVEAGYEPENAYFECIHEMKLIIDLINKGGVAAMNYSISDTAEFGEYVSGPRVIPHEETKARMRAVLSDIQDGTFAGKWIAENKNGRTFFNSKRAQLKKHQMELVGDELRRNMIWGGDKDLDTASN